MGRRKWMTLSRMETRDLTRHEENLFMLARDNGCLMCNTNYNLTGHHPHAIGYDEQHRHKLGYASEIRLTLCKKCHDSIHRKFGLCLYWLCMVNNCIKQYNELIRNKNDLEKQLCKELIWRINRPLPPYHEQRRLVRKRTKKIRDKYFAIKREILQLAKKIFHPAKFAVNISIRKIAKIFAANAAPRELLNNQQTKNHSDGHRSGFLYSQPF